MPIPVLIVDCHFAEASFILNPNAFPPQLKVDALSCCDRFAILTHSVNIVVHEPGLDLSRILKDIRENKAFIGFTPKPEKPVILVFHNLNFMSGLYSTLISIKSFLDLFSRLIARSIVPSARVFGFNSGNYKGRNLSGGKFLRWIERSAPRSFDNRDKLFSVLLDHIENWIDETVRYRDAAVHDGFIPGLNEVMIPLAKAISELEQADILLPKMPNGVAVTDYCINLIDLVRSLVSQTLPLLHDIDLTLVALDKI